MQKIKFNFGILAILLGLTAAFAFKAPAVAKPRTADVWYVFNGGDDTKPANYTKISGTPSCNSGANLCAIEGADNGLHPSQATVNMPDDTRNQP